MEAWACPQGILASLIGLCGLIAYYTIPPIFLVARLSERFLSSNYPRHCINDIRLVSCFPTTFLSTFRAFPTVAFDVSLTSVARRMNVHTNNRSSCSHHTVLGFRTWPRRLSCTSHTGSLLSLDLVRLASPIYSSSSISPYTPTISASSQSVY